MSKYARQSGNLMSLPPSYEGINTSADVAIDIDAGSQGATKTPAPKTSLFGMDENTTKLAILAIIIVALVYFMK